MGRDEFVFTLAGVCMEFCGGRGRKEDLDRSHDSCSLELKFSSRVANKQTQERDDTIWRTTTVSLAATSSNDSINASRTHITYISTRFSLGFFVESGMC